MPLGLAGGQGLVQGIQGRSQVLLSFQRDGPPSPSDVSLLKKKREERAEAPLPSDLSYEMLEAGTVPRAILG